MAHSLIIFWHRRDLRVTDNAGLTAAREASPKIVGVFCLDPNILQRDDIAPARMAYMIGSLQELEQSYAELGSRLLIIREDPAKGIPGLAAALGAKAVYWNLDVEPYSNKRDRTVSQALKEKGIKVKNFWDQLLHPPGAVSTGNGRPYTVYTPFWKNWSRKVKSEPLPSIPKCEMVMNLDWAIDTSPIPVVPLPSAKELGFVWEKPLILEPGEKAAFAQLDAFCNVGVFEYNDLRNFPGLNGTSRLSPALKFGTVGIRNVWNRSTIAWEESRSDESRLGVRTWQQELAWRDFYQSVMYYFPELADGPYREAWKNFPWDNNPEHFQAWCEGRTGFPLVDAAMRQLNETAWMHNRCRMIVASVLTKDLIIDWRWGEKYFMQKLIDGDLSANNGGWQWSASSGMDPKPIRMFNPATQARKFDRDAEYICEWLPELSGVNPEYLITGKIPVEERDRCGYPDPIVDRGKNQRLFKELYKRQKEEIVEQKEIG
ncbi:MAG: deoxyribodipyrimidine photolyase [Oscillatoria sp. SIO1A7]|nr:deoxyribodipyrimidine photolyase [Oscillatoria sp. SIO1A7]